MKVKSFSCVWLFGTLWTVAYQAPPSMASSRQEYWSELPFPSSRGSSQPRGLWHCKQTLFGSAGKESACNMGDPDSIPGLGRFPGEGKGYPFQYSGLENTMDCMVHGVAKSPTRLSNFHFHFTSL